MEKQVSIIYNRCIGCGKCFAICPHLFSLDDEGLAIVKNEQQTLSADEHEALLTATKQCPTRAIEVL